MNNEDEQYIWSSVGDSFTVLNDTENGARRGQERHEDLLLLKRTSPSSWGYDASGSGEATL